MKIAAQFMPGDLPVFVDSVRRAEEAATERIVEMLDALAAAGLDEVAPCYLNGRLDEMEIVGREIIPAVSALAA